MIAIVSVGQLASQGAAILLGLLLGLAWLEAGLCSSLPLLVANGTKRVALRQAIPFSACNGVVLVASSLPCSVFVAAGRGVGEAGHIHSHRICYLAMPGLPSPQCMRLTAQSVCCVAVAVVWIYYLVTGTLWGGTLVTVEPSLFIPSVVRHLDSGRLENARRPETS